MYSVPLKLSLVGLIGKIAILLLSYFLVSPYPNSQLHHFDSIATFVAKNKFVTPIYSLPF